MIRTTMQVFCDVCGLETNDPSRCVAIGSETKTIDALTVLHQNPFPGTPPFVYEYKDFCGKCLLELSNTVCEKIEELKVGRPKL